MSLFIHALSYLAVGGACWFFGWRQGKRGLPVISKHPTL